MSVLVKICGLSTPDTLDAALDAGADMVGFMFFPASPRNVSLEQARALGVRVQGKARKVAVTVDADDALLARIIETLEPDMLQLHGHDTPQRVAVVRESFGLPVMKVLPIETKSDLLPISSHTGVADRLLFDARAPREATRPGGLGKPFDWHLHAVSPEAPLVIRVAVETAMAMVDVIRTDEMSRLGVCADDGCEGLVLDLSRNRSRRFCSTACGNRNAVAAYRARKAGHGVG